MKAQTVGSSETPARLRELMQTDGVRKVELSDTHGHVILEVPVRPAEVGVVMEPVLAAAEAVSRVVGEVALRVEREGELPAEGGTRASMRERERAGAQAQATGAEMQDNVTAEELSRQPANVTQADVERIRQANAVPEGTAESAERIDPEQEGDPDLKDTATPFAADEARRGGGRPSR